jgi:hypothetical protein
MKASKFISALLMGVFSLTMGQTADEIIQKNIEVSGGKQAFKQLNSISLLGQIILGPKQEFEIKIHQKRPNFSKTLIKTEGQELLVDFCDGAKNYSYDFAKQKLSLKKDQKIDWFESELIDYQSKNFEAQRLDDETIKQKPHYKILLKNANESIVYLIDQKSFLLSQEIRNSEKINYANYKKVGPLNMPFRIESYDSKKKESFALLLREIILNPKFGNGFFVK